MKINRWRNKLFVFFLQNEVNSLQIWFVCKDPNSENTKPSTPPSRQPPPSSLHSFYKPPPTVARKLKTLTKFSYVANLLVSLCPRVELQQLTDPEAGPWPKNQPFTQNVTSTIAAPSVAEDLEAWESRAVTGVAMQTAAQLSLLWDPSHSAENASYKSWQCTSESHCWYSTFFK